MNLLLVVIQIFQLFVCVYFYRNSILKGILINITVLTHFSLYVLPHFIYGNKLLDLSNHIFFSSTGILFASLLLYNFFSKNQVAIRHANIKRILSKINLSRTRALLVCTYFFYALSLYSIYLSLNNAGGISSVLFSTGAGRDYLEARVNSSNSGILGLLIWFAPLSISYIFLDFQVELNKKFRNQKRILFITCFLVQTSGYLLLTVRHNIVSTILMLFIIYIFINRFSIKVFLLVGFSILSSIYVFQAVRLGVLNDFEINKVYENRSNESEHLIITKKIIEKADHNGYTYFTHINDVFIFLIPRAIWKNKPRTSFLNRTYFPNDARVGSEKAIGIIGEGYSMFGYFGVFVLCFVFVLLIGFFQIKIDRSSVNMITVLTSLAIVPLSYLGIRTGFFGKHLLSICIMLIQIKIFKILARKQ